MPSRSLVVVFALLVTAGLRAQEGPPPAASERELDRMMEALADQNAATSAIVREVYREHLNLLVLDQYDDLEDALGNGGLVPLPPEPHRFNVLLRTAGQHPIGELDIGNQGSYLTARPATIGCLLDVASRVRSGPIEVTSLVRHLDYQDELRGVNINATTNLPMHTMGMAFDIALTNMPLERAQEVLAVLQQMRDAGDLLFIGERRQLVFHVVPYPARIGYFTDIYSRALAMPPDILPGTQLLSLSALGPPTITRASVSAEIVHVGPTQEFSDAWWAAIDPSGDLTIRVADQPRLTTQAGRGRGAPATGRFWLAVFSAFAVTLVLLMFRQRTRT